MSTQEETICIPSTRKADRVWEVGAFMGAGMFGKVYEACQASGCTHVMKIVPVRNVPYFEVSTVESLNA